MGTERDGDRARARGQTVDLVAAFVLLVTAAIVAAALWLGAGPEQRSTGPATPPATTAATTTERSGSEQPRRAAPPAKGVFAGGFEGAEWEPFNDLQREDDRPVAESFALVEAPVRQGRRAARFTARQGYSRFGYNEDTSVIWQSGEQVGDEYWYAWSTQFPRDWVTPHRWGIFAQWHAKLGTSPIVSFNARADTALLSVQAGVTDERTNRSSFHRQIQILDTLSKGRWNDFVLHVRWRAGSSGLVEVFHRVAGERSLRRVASLSGIPTFQRTRAGRGLGTYLLLGIYRASYCLQPTQLHCTAARRQPVNVLYHDGFTRAKTFGQAVRYAFPGRAPLLTEAGVTGASSVLPSLALDVSAASAGTLVDRGCERCSVTRGRRRVTARIADTAEGQDTAVALYRLRQRSVAVIRQRLRVHVDRPAGNFVVSQLRRDGGGVLAEVYVDRDDGTVRVFSPAGALRPEGINVSSGVRVDGRGTAVELRVSATSLVLAVGGHVRVRVDRLSGPRSGARLVARIGVDHYDGAPGGGPLRVVHEQLAVGAAS